MNKDQVKGASQDAAGRIERKTGEAIGNDKMQVKGASKQVEGRSKTQPATQSNRPEQPESDKP